MFLEADGLHKRYGTVEALKGIGLEVAQGEVLCLLGPSGCGKSTTLRLLAGLERPDAGTIVLDGVTVADGRKSFMPAHRRNIGMVFQSFAVWPHMTVGEHVAFPLLLRHFGKADIRSRIATTLRLVGLEGLEDRRATNLSGGQQQRVGLARALVYEPQLLLLDEPLSNLDANLRHQMRIELKTLQRQLGTTTVYVTHARDEALALGDRVAIMQSGRIEQVGTPQEVYEAPANRFVHSFLGTSLELDGRWYRAQDGSRGTTEGVIDLGNGDMLRTTKSYPEASRSEKVKVAIRSEDVEIIPGEGQLGDNQLVATVEEAIYVGDKWEIRLRLSVGQTALSVESATEQSINSRVYVRFDPEKLQVWPG